MDEHLDLDYFLTDRLIISDLEKVLKEEVGELPIELDDDLVSIPLGVKLEIVSKSYRQSTYKNGFCNHYEVQVAIGGVAKKHSSILYPKYCFATLFYTDKKELITLDFHSQMR